MQTISSVSLTANSNVSTTFQGAAGLSSLAPGTLVNMDLAIQSDGSLLATRVEVNDTAAVAVFVGPFLQPTAGPGVFTIWTLACFLAPGNPGCDNVVLTDSSTVFSISGQVSNLQNLPFSPSFTSSSMFFGQNAANFTPGSRNAQDVPLSTTVTLEPQTINGTVTAISNTNGVAVYIVALAPYDLIPTLQQALAPASMNLLDPSTVVVYADSNTQFLDSGSIGAGSVLRFRGLIFNDNGTLRMDCAEVADGVPE